MSLECGEDHLAYCVENELEQLVNRRSRFRFQQCPGKRLSAEHHGGEVEDGDGGHYPLEPVFYFTWGSEKS